MAKIRPDQFTRQEAMIPVGNGHELYTQLWGSADSDNRFVFLHGGPGSGCAEGYKQLFDPTQQLVLFLDQRSSGHSSPRGSLEHNTTQDLIEDINRVADAHGFDRFGVVGRSWGSCLGLLYSLENAERVNRMIIGAVFTAREAERAHLYRGGFRAIFPDLWDSFTATVPNQYANDPAALHLGRILGDDPEAAKLSAYIIDLLGGALEGQTPPTIPQNLTVPTGFDPTGMKIQVHYDMNAEFIPENYIFDHLEDLQIPTRIVQGRHDFICPPITAYEVGRRIAGSEIQWTSAGHDTMAPENLTAMRTAIATDY